MIPAKSSTPAETGQRYSPPDPARWVIGRPLALFLLFSFALTLVLFWPAALGQKILAPLDIPANFFPKFRYVDPNANGVPANHYVIDLILGDISRNLLVYDAWSRDEMPWWDPYTDAGRPLAAEANAVNISDPWKMLIFRVLPFELAYNWIRIIPFILSGAAAFCLLRRLDFSLAPSFWGALLYQFAGCNFMMFSGPTIQASFAYYPLLWLLWDRGVGSNKSSWFVGSSLVTALVFLSGNLQSHSYVFVFTLAFIFGYGWRKRARWGQLLLGTTCSVAPGLLLAAPFVLSQIEMFFLSVRRIRPETAPLELLSGVVSLAAGFFPWVLGTFRTLDLSKVLAQSGLGFWIYIGSAAMILAAIGLFTQIPAGSRCADVKRTAIALLIAYLLVCSTPLLRLLYTRTAWLAVLGLIVLFAFGWERLARGTFPSRRLGFIIIAATAAVVLALNVTGFLVYPRLQSRIEARVLAKDQRNPNLDQAPALRRFQVGNLPNEITFKNLETVFACCGLVAIGLMIVRATKRPHVWLHATLALSTAPLLWFGHRYVPMHSAELWKKIREGGPEQHRVMAAIGPERLRLFENADGSHEFVFPGALGQPFGAHVCSGHTSLILQHAGLQQTNRYVAPELYDYEYRSGTRGLEQGELHRREGGEPARFRWATPNERKVTVSSETLSTITLDVQAGPAADLIRTDTYYPGWRIASPATGVQMLFEPPCFARIPIPANVTQLQLKYEPRWWQPGICIAGVALVVITVYLVVNIARQKQSTRPSAV